MLRSTGTRAGPGLLGDHMSFSLRRSVAVIATGLVAALVVLPSQVARAETSTLAVSALSTAEGQIQATYTGTVTALAYLYSFHQDASIPCAATPAAAANANAREMTYAMLQPGPFSTQLVGATYGPGRYVVCGYLAILDSTPGAPGPRYATPTATASTILLLSPCSEVDTTFTLTSIDAQTTWDSQVKETVGVGRVSVDVNDPGTLVVTGPGMTGGDETMELGAHELEAFVSDTYPGDGRTKDSEYVLTFYPGGYQPSCAADDGTIVNLGPDGDFHAAPQTLEVTWFIAGQGARATVGGVVLPGSSTPHAVPSRTPVVTGPHRVAEKDTCSVTIPEGEPYQFVWEADGKRAGKGRTLALTPDLLGKSLTCIVINNGPHGFPDVTSDEVTVEIGTIRNTKLPKIFGDPSAGGAVALDYGKWAPAMANNSGLKYRYQWYLGTKAIRGATKGNYSIPVSAKGKKISCKMTVSAPGFKDASATSKAVTIR